MNGEHPTNPTDSRIESIQNLQNFLLPLDESIDFASLEALNSPANSFVPSIGSEIEVTWSSRFPEISKRVLGQTAFKDMTGEQRHNFNLLCTELDEAYLPLYEATTKLGVPRDAPQKFWEFAHSPASHYEVLAQEISLLMRSDIIPTGYNLSHHITLGNVKMGSGTMFVHAATEMSGGTTPERIRAAIGKMPIYERIWARKSSPTGSRERSSLELAGANYGVEFRTFVANDPEQVKNTLRTTQLLATALNAHRAIITNQVDDPDDHREALSSCWVDVVDVVKSLDASGIPFNTPWQGPDSNPDMWLRFADFLDGKLKPDLLANLQTSVAKTCNTIESILTSQKSTA